MKPRPGCGVGGCGLSTLPPNTCSNFRGSYTDAHSTCVYIANFFAAWDPSPLNLDDAQLNGEAQAAAEAVASGGAPQGTQMCSSGNCNWCSGGAAYDVGENGQYIYVSGVDASGSVTADSVYTSPDADWYVQWDSVAHSKACGFISDSSIMRNMFYHGVPFVISRIGCGVAVDQYGITWRTLKPGL